MTEAHAPGDPCYRDDDCAMHTCKLCRGTGVVRRDDAPVILAGSVDGPGRVELRMSVEHAHALRDLLRWSRSGGWFSGLLADIDEALR